LSNKFNLNDLEVSISSDSSVYSKTDDDTSDSDLTEAQRITLEKKRKKNDKKRKAKMEKKIKIKRKQMKKEWKEQQKKRQKTSSSQSSSQSSSSSDSFAAVMNRHTKIGKQYIYIINLLLMYTAKRGLR